MSADDAAGSVIEMAVVRGRILLSIILDALFLGVWLAMLWLFDLTTAHIQNSGDLEWRTAKALLGISTLFCIALFIYWDLKAANELFRREYQKNSQNAKDVRSTASPSNGGADDV